MYKKARAPVPICLKIAQNATTHGMEDKLSVQVGVQFASPLPYIGIIVLQ